MATRNIIKVGDDLLRKVSKPVSKFDENLADILDDMWETMKQNDGMGLAAPQIGILRRIIIVSVNNLNLELINPEIISQKGSQCEKEGCLSVGKIQKYVKRPYKVTIKAKDREGEEFIITGQKYLAICLCHEIDHLNGILFVDKALDDNEVEKK